jgi:tetratricopeptide (TPR) repeat protein
MRCPECRREDTEGNRFCTFCGTPLAAASPTPPTPSDDLPPTVVTPRYSPTPPDIARPPFAASVAPPHNRKPLLMAVSVSALALVAAAVGGYFYFFSAQTAILAAVKKGDLVKPAGDSAYDLFVKSKGRLSDEARKQIAAAAVPKLEGRGGEILTQLKQESHESEEGWAEAVRVYDWLMELRSDKRDEARRHFAQARLDLFKREYARAVTGFRRVLEIEPSWALAYNSLGKAFYNVPDKGRARDNYVRATEIEPEWITPYLNLGALCTELGRHDEAEAALRRALALNPEKASAHFLLGQLYEKLRQPCAAVAAYRAALNHAGQAANPGFNVEQLSRKVQKMDCADGY